MNIEDVKKLVFISLEVPYNSFRDMDLLLSCPTWDSIGVLTLIANFKENFNIDLNSKILLNLKTFSDLFDIIINLPQ
jgi:acyl carrier protein